MKNLKLSPKISKYVYIASGSTNPDLASAIASSMGLKVGDIERRQFPNTEQYIRYNDTVRGCHVFVVQSLAMVEGRSVNDSLMEVMLMVDAAKRSSAARVTVVLPYLAYSRQDRKARGREPISAAVVIRMLQSAGVDRIVTIDLHSPQTQATFNGPFDHLTAEPVLRRAMQKRIQAGSLENYVVVSPDGGRAKAAEDYADELGVDVVHMPKSRSRLDPTVPIRPASMHGVEDKICLLIDDLIDTAGTLVSAAETLHRSGAKSVIVGSTHGIFSGPALNRLRTAPIDEIYMTDTVPLNDAIKVLGDKLYVLSIAPLVGRALCEIVTDGSVSDMFNDRNNR